MVFLSALLLLSPGLGACPTFRISVDQPGRVRVHHAELASAGLVGELPSASLRPCADQHRKPISISACSKTQRQKTQTWCS